MQIWLDRAGPADRELLYRLLQYSLYEESAHDGNVMGPDGLFEYPWFDLYFTDPDREAYFDTRPGRRGSAGLYHGEHGFAAGGFRPQRGGVYGAASLAAEGRGERCCQGLLSGPPRNLGGRAFPGE